MNPVSQVENHPRCRTNVEGEPLLPNDTVWKQQLVMFITSSKLLVDTEDVLQIKQEPAQNRTQCASPHPMLAFASPALAQCLCYLAKDGRAVR